MTIDPCKPMVLLRSSFIKIVYTFYINDLQILHNDFTNKTQKKVHGRVYFSWQKKSWREI